MLHVLTTCTTLSTLQPEGIIDSLNVNVKLKFELACR